MALYVIISNSHRSSAARCYYFHFNNQPVGLTLKVIVETPTVRTQHTCPSHSSTDGVSSCFPILYSMGFVLVMNPLYSSLSSEMIHLFSHLAVIYWALFSVLTIEQQARQKVPDSAVCVHIPKDARQHSGRLSQGDVI